MLQSFDGKAALERLDGDLRVALERAAERPTRGPCSVCGWDGKLTMHGLVRRHGRERNTRSDDCPGSGHPPASTDLGDDEP